MASPHFEIRLSAADYAGVLQFCNGKFFLSFIPFDAKE